jgi:hypothetical protein
MMYSSTHKQHLAYHSILYAAIFLLVTGCSLQLSPVTSTTEMIIFSSTPTIRPTLIATSTSIAPTADGTPFTPISISPLDSDPCKAPCWQNITPGSTTIEDAWTVIFDALDQEEACQYTDTFNQIVCENINISAPDMLQPIEYIILVPTVEVTLAELLDMFGEPQTIYIGLFGVDYLMDIEIIIPYPEQGAYFYFMRRDGNWLVEPTLVVDQMLYQKPGTPFLNFVGEQVGDADWHGYGDY